MSIQKTRRDNGHLLSTSEAADLLCVHPNTLRRWADANLLRSFRIGPRRDRRFLRQDVEDHFTRTNGGNDDLNG
jgi:excisionase family DNA binding protein